jgi:hypothetical protein
MCQLGKGANFKYQTGVECLILFDIACQLPDKKIDCKQLSLISDYPVKAIFYII